MCSIIFVEFFLNITVGDHRRRCGQSRKIGSQRRPVSMNEVETFGLAIKFVGVSCFKLLFQIKGRKGIILAGDGQDRLEGAVNLRVPEAKSST